MNKKYFLIMFIVLLVTIGSVSAVNMEKHNFDNYFTMDIPEGSSVETQDDSGNESEDDIALSFISEDWLVIYYNSAMFSGDSVSWLYQNTFNIVNEDLDGCIEYQDGDLRILRPENEDGNHLILVGTHSENETIMIMGTDFELVKEMAHTLKY